MELLVGIPALLVAALVGYFVAVTREILPSPRVVAATISARFYKRAEGNYFTILVSRLARDADDSQTDHVFSALDAINGIDVVRTPQILKLDPKNSANKAREEAERRGRKWLDRFNADVIVWGQVAEQNQTLRLSFTGRTSATESHGTYQLESTELPAGFSQELGTHIVASALAAVEPATEQQGQYLVDVLLPVAEKLENLLGGGGLEDGDGRLHASLGSAFSVIGEQSGDSGFLVGAINAYRDSLTLSPRDKNPERWATTQNNLGNALSRLGARESGTERLEEAVDAYRAAHEERTRERVPLDWAMTQNNLGTALARLGERESGTKRLEEAVNAFRAALEVWTRERVPLDWATTQNNLGETLRAFGERESGTERLEDAVEAFRAALEVFREAGASYYIGGTEENLSRGERLLEERRASLANAGVSSEES